MNTKRSDGESIIRYRSWIQARQDPATLPHCRIVSRELHPNREPTLTFHVAGERHLWVIPLRVAAKHTNLLNAFDEADRAVVEWAYKNDNMIEEHYYQDSDSE